MEQASPIREESEGMRKIFKLNGKERVLKDRQHKLQTAGLFLSNAIQVLDGLDMHEATELLCKAYGEVKDEQEIEIDPTLIAI